MCRYFLAGQSAQHRSSGTNKHEQHARHHLRDTPALVWPLQEDGQCPHPKRSTVWRVSRGHPTSRETTPKLQRCLQESPEDMPRRHRHLGGLCRRPYDLAQGTKRSEKERKKAATERRAKRKENSSSPNTYRKHNHLFAATAPETAIQESVCTATNVAVDKL